MSFAEQAKLQELAARVLALEHEVAQLKALIQEPSALQALPEAPIKRGPGRPPKQSAL